MLASPGSASPVFCRRSRFSAAFSFFALSISRFILLGLAIRTPFSSSRRQKWISRRFDPAAVVRGEPERSDHANVLCLFALPAGSDIELDLLTLGEGLEACRLDAREVHEHVVAIFTADEAVTLVVVEELDSTCRQNDLFSLMNSPVRRVAPT